MKKLILVMLCAALLCGSAFTVRVAAEEEYVKTEINGFVIRINGVDFGEHQRHLLGEKNSICEYPMMLYNGAVYIPLSYYNCILLGLNTEMRDGTFFIEKAPVPESPNLYQMLHLSEERTETALYAKKAPFAVNMQGTDYTDTDYPILIYNNIVCIPLTYNVVNDIMDWSYTWYCWDNGRGNKIYVTLYTDSYWYYSEGFSGMVVKYNPKTGSGSRGTDAKTAATYWSENGVRIEAFTRHTQNGPVNTNLKITAGETKIVIPGHSCYGQEQGPLFTLKDGYIYTTNTGELEGENMPMWGPCKISIETGEITYLDSWVMIID